MSFTVIIPARYGSSRLPGKPLAMIGDKPMVQHVYEQALASQAARVIIATDDPRIVDAAQAIGAEVCLTAGDHLSGTDRLQEVAQRYHLADEHIVVNVQGDEPRIPPEVINQVAANLAANPQAVAATLCEPITVAADFHNPNIVKVVVDHRDCALYFSRAPIPYDRQQSDRALGQRHIGIYAYRVSLLHQFVHWPAAPLESVESLEQLRILSQGKKMHVSAAICQVPGGVDTPEDLQRLRALLL
ncbi:MAG: 3-deoxy-manno-octulosonate cytidylyltransferase [Cellvibrionaceae bacterium]|nr:3-deoxy-manno-octulosonate cytidylyltransferase [Cellvibrionaceae bacterium]